MLEYALIQSFFATAKGKFTAKVQNSVSYSFDDVIDLMAQGGSSLSRNEMVSVVESFFVVVAQIVAKGGTVHTDDFHLRFSISGTFDAASDQFDPKKQSLHLNIIPSKHLVSALEKVVPQKVAPQTQTGIVITEVKDSTTGSVNANITSGGAVEIVGSYLKIAGSDPQIGVYFTATTSSGVQVPQKVQVIPINQPSRLLITAPTLTAGTYKLEIKTQFNSTARGLAAVRSATFNLLLTVS